MSLEKTAMRSNENEEGRRLAEVMEARIWQYAWLKSYLAAGGIIYDPGAKRWIGQRENNEP